MSSRTTIRSTLTALVVLAGTATGGQTSSGLIVLHPTAEGALSMNGTSTVVIPSMVAYVNSSSAQAVKTVGTAVLDVPRLYVVGGASFGGQSHCTGTVVPSTSAYLDPLAHATMPTSAGMEDKGGKSFNGATALLSPGYYSGGISVKGNSNITFSPGVYVIGGTGLKVTAGSIMGDGVTIVMEAGPLSIAGTSSLSLSPPTGGDLPGVVIAQPKANANGMSLAGGSQVHISGTIYVPGANLTLVGTSDIVAEGPQMGDLVIAETLTLKGNSTIRIGGPESQPVRLPTATALYD